jgi:hypothetical protein
MYGLPQTGVIAQGLIKNRLAKHGYKQSNIIPGFQKHATNPICIILVVDDFTVKYRMEKDADHLISALKADYDIAINRTAAKYTGLMIE